MFFIFLTDSGDLSPTEIISANNGRRLSLSSNSTGTKNGNGNLLSQLTKSTIVSIFVIVLLSFLFCSSLYLVFRIDSLQKQVKNCFCQFDFIFKYTKKYKHTKKIPNNAQFSVLFSKRLNLKGSIF